MLIDIITQVQVKNSSCKKMDLVEFFELGLTHYYSDCPMIMLAVLYEVQCTNIKWNKTSMLVQLWSWTAIGTDCQGFTKLHSGSDLNGLWLKGLTEYPGQLSHLRLPWTHFGSKWLIMQTTGISISDHFRPWLSMEILKRNVSGCHSDFKYFLLFSGLPLFSPPETRTPGA